METIYLSMSLNTLNHELRTPLTGILGAAQFLEEGFTTPDRLKECLNILKQSSNRLLKFADTLSASAKKSTPDTTDNQGDLTPKITKRCQILLVEDDPIIQIVHKRLLLNMGHQVELAKTAQEAIDKVTVAAKSQGYDLILMDVGLPDMTGIEASLKIRLLKGPERSTPIIALTAYDTEDVKNECQAAKIQQVLTKPVTAEQLQKALEIWTKP